jgi:hypothetical protein
MTSNDQAIRSVTVDRSEFLEAVKLMLAHRQSAPPALRAEIDRAVRRLEAGEGLDELRICWHDTTPDGDTVVHVTAGPGLLKLALPSSALDPE